MNLPKSRRANPGDTQVEMRPARAAIFAGALMAPYAVVSLLTSGPKAIKPASVKDTDRFDYEGDAVSSPQLEVTLLELCKEGATPKDPARYAQAATVVAQLEAQGGPQLFASKAPGRWCIPWVGGWERVWASEPAVRFPGGPSSETFSLDASKGEPAARAGSALFSLSSSRQFIYGPGEGGMVVESLYSAPGVPKELLLTQLADVNNLGGNFFDLTFKDQLKPYVAARDASGTETLARKEPVESSMAFGPASEKATLQTTYLSASLWVIVDEAGRKAAFARTETRSVSDRRGIVVSGQAKEHPDEETRYGKLLFGETLSEYQGWEDAVDAQAPSSRIKGLLNN